MATGDDDSNTRAGAGDVMLQRPRVRVAAFVAAADRVLLVQQHRSAEAAGPAYWLLPGGGVHGGETLAEAAVREVAEETGVRVQPGPPIALVESISPDPGYPKHVIHVVLRATWPSSAPSDDLASTDPHILAVRFVEAGELDGLQLRPPLTAHLRRWLGDPPSTFEYVGRLW